MKLTFYLVILSLLFMHNSICHAQESEVAPGPRQPGKITKVITLPDGSTETHVFAPNVDAKAQALQMQLVRGFGPVVNILDTLTFEDVDNLVDDELTEDQSAKLTSLLKEYRKEKAALDATSLGSGLILLRVKYGKQLTEILLPEQIQKTTMSGFIFKVLTTEDGPVPKYLDLRKRQQSSIENKCETLHSELIDLVNDFEKKKEKLKERVTNTLIDNLDEDQREKLERLVGVPLEEYFKNYSLETLIEQTQLVFDN
jgi:hypothetical protein